MGFTFIIVAYLCLSRLQTPDLVPSPPTNMRLALLSDAVSGRFEYWYEYERTASDLIRACAFQRSLIPCLQQQLGRLDLCFKQVNKYVCVL